MINQLFSILGKQRFSLENEKETQREMAQLLNMHGIAHTREFALDKKSVIDFMLPEHGIGIEVKIKGGKKAIYRQCERYCQFDEIKSIILVTSKSMGMLQEINNKPVYLINISKSWL